MRIARGVVFTAVLVQLFSGQAAAIPLTMTFEGTGSGTIGTTPFVDATFLVMLTVETDNNGYIGGTLIPATEWATTTIEIQGIGTATFTTDKRVFCNRSAMGVGLIGDFDLIVVEEPSLASYDLTTPFGPTLDVVACCPSQFQNIPTDLGDLSFSALNNVTFLAVSSRQDVPMASPLAGLALVLLIAGTGFLALRRLSS